MNINVISFLPVLAALVSGLLLMRLVAHFKSSGMGVVRVVICTFWTMLIFAAIAFLTTRFESLETRFRILSAGSFVLGIAYIFLAPLTLDWWDKNEMADVVGFNIALLCFAICGSLVIYQIAVPVEKTMLLLQGTLAFAWPSLALKAYDYWLSIPSRKYKSWSYPIHEPVPRLLPVETIKVKMNFTPVPGPPHGFFEGYDVEFPSNVSLGELFHYFISFHNKHREYRKNPIQFMTDDHQPLEWVMYRFVSGKKKIYLNTDQTLAENQIGPSENIYAASLTR